MPAETLRPSDVLHFWFEQAGEEKWFKRTPDFDAEIRDRFAELHGLVTAEFPESWLSSRDGLLAGIIVLDQISRNLYRGDARAYASDADALNLANLAIERGWDQDYAPQERAFCYMPFMHAEDMRAQDRSVELFAALDHKDHLKYAESHREVIRRFGRFPGRNRALARRSTPEEQAYLDEGGGF